MTGKVLVERIDAYLEERNIKRQALCDAAGIATNTLTAWKRRGNLPQADVLNKIAKFFGMTIDQFLNGLDDEENVLQVKEEIIQYSPETNRSRREREILKDLHVLSDNEIETVFAMVHGLADARRHERTMRETVG